ncbi:MAG TPA: hypothetical protein VFU02_22630, partial [Polyangiaceae bacterium]|nr:hypothetical protein [Polyangiaceae bacterium]
MRAKRGALFVVLVALACDREESPSSQASAESARSRPAPPQSTAAASALPYDTPRLLFLPDAGDWAPPEAPFSELLPKTPVLGRCPAEMVEINHSFCIDRY